VFVRSLENLYLEELKRDGNEISKEMGFVG
jgi:hypothetical protein